MSCASRDSNGQPMAAWLPRSPGVGFTMDDFLGLDHTGLLQPGREVAVYRFDGSP